MRGGRGEEEGRKRGGEEEGVRTKVGDQPPSHDVRICVVANEEMPNTSSLANVSCGVAHLLASRIQG